MAGPEKGVQATGGLDSQGTGSWDNAEPASCGGGHGHLPPMALRGPCTVP